MSDITFTDKNFEEEVLKSDVPVLVDFWAPWCVAEDATIQTGYGLTHARKIKTTDPIVSYQPRRGRVMDEVIHSRTSTKDGHCRSIVTETGRRVRVTDDHEFFTKRGWQKAVDLTEQDRVAILSLVKNQKTKAGVHKKGVLMPGRRLLPFWGERMQTEKYLEELSQKGLLPLKWNDERLPRLSRLAGALFSDGSLYQSKRNNYREISFIVGQKQDAEDICQDLRLLGFEAHIKERTTHNKIGGRTFSLHTFRVKCCSTALYVLMRALGIPEGKKTDVDYEVPLWIRQGSSDVKREFLAAYMGGDGPKIDIRLQSRPKKEAYNKFSINDIEFHKRADLVRSGLGFARQLSNLFSQFGVKNLRIFSKTTSYYRKDKQAVEIVHIRFKHNLEIALALARIGYRYSRQKEIQGLHAGAFLEELGRRREAWQEKYQAAVKKARQGLSVTKIGASLNIAPETVYGWVKQGKRPTIGKHFLKFQTWLEQATGGLRDGLTWEQVKEVSQVHLARVQVISTKRVHNFFANGFLVHNCGPCRVQGPVIEELAKEHDGKAVKIGKLNVDENPKTAQSYQIMSIPTLGFFKGGEMIDQAVGVQQKSDLEKRIEEMTKKD